MGKKNRYEVEFMRVSMQTVTIEADSSAEAVKLVEEGKFDEGSTYFHIDDFQRTVTDITKLED